MQLIINGQPTDFTLQAEKTYGDILEGISKWAASQNHVLRSIQLNGKTPSGQWKEKQPAESDTIEVQVYDKVLARKEEISLLGEFFSVVEAVLEQGNEDSLLEIQKEYRALSPNLPTLLLEQNLEAKLRFSSLLDSLILDPSFPPKSQKEKDVLLAAVQQVLDRISLYAKESFDPEQGLAIHKKVIEDNWQELKSIPTLFQSGQDAQALSTLMLLLSSTGGIFRMANLLGEDSLGEHKDIYRELQEFFSELESAMVADDLVLAGDLVEYEILPRLASAIEIVDEPS